MYINSIRNLWTVVDEVHLKKEKNLFIIIAALYFILRIPLFFTSPLVLDEGLYAINIQEQINNPSIVPIFLGQAVGWKPPLFFWVYAPLVFILEKLPLDIVFVFGLPTLVFGLINVFLLYFIIQKVYGNQELSFYTTLIFTGFYLNSHVNTTVLIDTFNLTLILSAIYCCVNTKWDNRRFLAVALFTILAFFTKLWVAAVIPVVVLSWAFFHSKGSLKNNWFIPSLLVLPLAFLLYNLYIHVFSSTSLFQDASPAYTIMQRMFDGGNFLATFYGLMIESLGPLFGLITIWVGFFAFSIFKNWKKFSAMTILSFLIFPVALGARYMPWYFLPVLIPIAFFSALLILTDKKNGPDLFGFVFCILILFITFIVGYLFYHYSGYDNEFAQTEVAYLLAFKPNVLIVGDYSPTLMSYKIVTESRKNGKYLDFGVIIPSNNNTYMPKDIQIFIYDYYNNDLDVSSNMMDIMPPSAKHQLYRKNTSITQFDYIVLNRMYNITLNETLIYNKSGVLVYHMDN